MSNLIKFQNPVDLHRFCVFEILVRPQKNGWKRSLFHILNGCAQIFSPTGSCNGPWNSRVVSLVWPLLVSQSSSRRLAMAFLMLLSAFAKLYIPHMPKFCMPTFGNGRNNTKTACICLYRVLFPTCIGKPGAIFSAHVNIRQTSSVVILGFRQTVFVLRRSWHSKRFDSFPGPFDIMPLSVAGP